MIWARRREDFLTKRMADLAGSLSQQFGHHWWPGDFWEPQEQVEVGLRFGGKLIRERWAF